MNQYPPPWDMHVHAWVCYGTRDQCAECHKIQTFDEWLEARREYNS